jgi:hypothetical protein
MVSPLTPDSRLRWEVDSSPELSGEEISQSQFYCRLDELPNHLTPEHSLRNLPHPEPNQRLIVNPNCRFSPDGKLPHGGAESDPAALHNFAAPRETVWVRDPGSEVLLPFWLGARLRHWLCGLKPGEDAPAGLPPEIDAVLRLAHVLVPEDWIEARRCQWLAATSRAAETFRRYGYVPLPYLLHPFQLAALRRYYRYKSGNGSMEYDGLQAGHRLVAHNESVARFFHQQLTASVSILAGEPTKPSYVFVACYEEGAVLQKHVDREQCEFSITVCIDYTPEPQGPTPWPLQVDLPAGQLTVYQALGDGLLYRGTQLPHSRNRLRPGHTSTSIFFHYVPQTFSGSLD